MLVEVTEVYGDYGPYLNPRERRVLIDPQKIKIIRPLRGKKNDGTFAGKYGKPLCKVYFLEEKASPIMVQGSLGELKKKFNES